MEDIVFVGLVFDWGSLLIPVEVVGEENLGELEDCLGCEFFGICPFANEAIGQFPPELIDHLVGRGSDSDDLEFTEAVVDRFLKGWSEKYLADEEADN